MATIVINFSQGVNDSTFGLIGEYTLPIQAPKEVRPMVVHMIHNPQIYRMTWEVKDGRETINYVLTRREIDV